MTDIFNEKVGLLKDGTIVSFDPATATMEVQLNTAPAVKGQRRITVTVPAPHALFHNNGLFIGTYPHVGTPVVVGQGSSNQYFFVSFKSENVSLVPDLKQGELLISSGDGDKITLDTSNVINIGSDVNNIHIDTGDKNRPKTNLISLNFENENHFTQAHREINGLIKRDLSPNTNYDQDTKLENDKYDKEYKIIGLDPTMTSNDVITGSTKNPPFVEHREIVYEFQYQSGITNDLSESTQYNNIKPDNPTFTKLNRRKSRADTLSLTLLEPNYLIETTKGTVVDIFGNILDLNRVPLSVGKDQNTLRADKSSNKRDSYLKIRELERKSIAFHFEINARKDLSQKSSQNSSTLDLLDINSNADNSRLRSRFFIDVDKEGQFKINVPASSEKGNVPFLTRYENYSTFGTEDSGNPNKLIKRDDNLDIFLDSFAAPPVILGDSFSFSTDRGSISIKDDKGEAAPIDRITTNHIKHGTAHHDILNTCWVFRNRDFLDYQNGTTTNTTVDINSIPLLENIVSDTIIIDGAGLPDQGGPNAGGRSGSINLDGMLEWNIGANTIDRQSLWVDFAGGSVINLGKDRRSRSAMISADGDVYMQIGSFGITGDSRFIKDANGIFGSVLDLRILNAGGQTHMIRCDNNGITIMTHVNLAIHATQDIKISSDANVEIDCETLTVQGRMILKEFGGSI